MPCVWSRTQLSLICITVVNYSVLCTPERPAQPGAFFLSPVRQLQADVRAWISALMPRIG